MQRRTAIGLIGLGTIGAASLTAMSWAQTAEEATPAPDGVAKQITIWRDPNCGCCDAYAEYLEANGYQVTRVDDRDFDKRSVAAGVPEQGLGCHLAEINGYYVSGLVPAEIIERLKPSVVVPHHYYIWDVVARSSTLLPAEPWVKRQPKSRFIEGAYTSYMADTLPADGTTVDYFGDHVAFDKAKWLKDGE